MDLSPFPRLRLPAGRSGAELWSAGSDWTIKRWDIAGEKCLGTLTEHTDKVESLAVSADGTIVASAGGDKSIRLWNAETGAALYTLNGHTKAVRAVAFSPDGKTFAVGGAGIKLWDQAVGSRQAKIGDVSPKSQAASKRRQSIASRREPLEDKQTQQDQP